MKTKPCKHLNGTFKDSVGYCCNDCRCYVKAPVTPEPPKVQTVPTDFHYDPTLCPPCVSEPDVNAYVQRSLDALNVCIWKKPGSLDLVRMIDEIDVACQRRREALAKWAKDVRERGG